MSPIPLEGVSSARSGNCPSSDPHLKTGRKRCFVNIYFHVKIREVSAIKAIEPDQDAEKSVEGAEDSSLSSDNLNVKAVSKDEKPAKLSVKNVSEVIETKAKNLEEDPKSVEASDPLELGNNISETSLSLMLGENGVERKDLKMGWKGGI